MKHTNQRLQTRGKWRVMRIFERGIENSHLADLLKRSGVVAQFVQQDTQSPNVALFINGLPAPDVDHFWTSVLHSRVPLDIFFNQSALLCGGSSWPRSSGTAKITKLVNRTLCRVCDEHIFDLQVSVQERRLEVVHGSQTLADVAKNVQDFGLGQAVLQTRVHKVNQTTARAKLHEQKDLVAAALELAGVAVKVCDNVLVSLQLLHRLDFCTHVGEGILVRTGNSLEHGDGVFGRGILGRYADRVDVGKTSLGKVLFDYYTVGADLDLGAWRKGSRRGDWGLGVCCRSLSGGVYGGHDGGGWRAQGRCNRSGKVVHRQEGTDSPREGRRNKEAFGVENHSIQKNKLHQSRQYVYSTRIVCYSTCIQELVRLASCSFLTWCLLLVQVGDQARCTYDPLLPRN
jgi:hypothetical protein